MLGLVPAISVWRFAPEIQPAAQLVALSKASAEDTPPVGVRFPRSSFAAETTSNRSSRAKVRPDAPGQRRCSSLENRSRAGSNPCGMRLPEKRQTSAAPRRALSSYRLWHQRLGLVPTGQFLVRY